MSTVAAKKPPVTGRDPNSTLTSSSPSASRATPRSSTPTSSAAAAGGSAQSHARSRSFRSGTPVSARAAAGQRRESPLSSTNGPSSNTANVEAEEAARAETVALLDDLKDRLAKAETTSEDYRKQAEVLQSKLDETISEQVKYEEKCHEHEEQIEALQNEQRESTRKIREMEAIYEAERSAMVKEKEEMSNREEQLQMIIARLKDSLNQKMSKEDNDDEIRSTRSLNPTSPGLEGGSFAPPASLSRSDSRNQSKLVMQKDKLIESLRLELAEAQIKLVESENRGGGRLHEVEKLLMETRMANARLMEDNESYQLLLQEKTLNGDFKNSDFSYMGGPQSNDDALAALEGKAGGASLADELGDAADGEEQNDTVRRLEADVRSMKDQNKALTLYINRIIERLLQHQDFEHILDQTEPGSKPDTNKDLPAPPREASGSSVLQRAKSMAISNPTAGTKPRPRPMSVMPTAANLAQFSNPDTAPSIPIGMGRSHSTRRVRPMSEQITGAASIVNNMYKGPDGPLSPISRNSQTFFSTPQRERNTSGATASSVPGNFPGMRSETSSVSGDSSSQMTGDKDTISSTPNQSPPREKKVTQKFDAGNKPRPLRLVQENNEAQAAANKRQSWIGGWFAKKEEVTSPRESSIRE
ncbi:hypothetical protein J7T55_013454 [Diaporthe amygdali]|uniref:uncharacterized protein n=1 Tax=Phomopsis amygdali TaxID=1214568 RepID=UPI0022FED60D|nr:uncharacterized protein J7T55_013454 [Diaporthe amygdali]KAJ0119217.1 hypothetical protein J7T55_013454 [Diaporthe amygdali]